MKMLNVTYDVLTDGKMRETCLDISIMDDVADRLVEKGSSGIAVNVIEKALTNLEMLKGRTYIKGSIKHFEYSE